MNWAADGGLVSRDDRPRASVGKTKVTEVLLLAHHDVADGLFLAIIRGDVDLAASHRVAIVEDLCDQVKGIPFELDARTYEVIYC
jgi:hypothetical protein